jgi:nuclear pore complex protein Nup54
MTSLFGAPAQNTGSSLFGNTANKSPFGATATNTQPTGGGLFGQQNQQQGSLGGSTFGASTTPQTQPSGGLFGNAQKPQNSLLGGSTFGQPQQQQQQQPQQQSSAFGTSLGQKPQGSLFGGPTSGVQSTATGMFGQQNQQQQTQQPQQPQQSQFGQTTMATPQGQQQQPPLASSLWSPGRAITGGKNPKLCPIAYIDIFI